MWLGLFSPLLKLYDPGPGAASELTLKNSRGAVEISIFFLFDPSVERDGLILYDPGPGDL